MVIIMKKISDNNTIKRNNTNIKKLDGGTIKINTTEPKKTEKKEEIASEVIEVLNLSTNVTRNSADYKFQYSIEQNEFLNKTNKFTDEVSKIMKDNCKIPKEFSFFTSEILKTRREMCLFDFQKNYQFIPRGTGKDISTNLDKKYEKEFKCALKNIYNEKNKIIPIDNIYKDFEIFKDNQHFKFTPIYKENPNIELTTTYWSHGKMLPALNYGCANIEYNAITVNSLNIYFDNDSHILSKENVEKQINKMTEYVEMVLSSDTLEFLNKNTPRIAIKHDDDDTITDCGLFHVKGEKVQENLDEINKQYQEYKNNKKANNTLDAFNNICNMVYLFGNTCPYGRGSAWGTEVLATVFFKDLFNNDTINFIRSDLDFQCFSQSSDRFKKYIKRILPLTEKQMNSIGLYEC